LLEDMATWVPASRPISKFGAWVLKVAVLWGPGTPFRRVPVHFSYWLLQLTAAVPSWWLSTQWWSESVSAWERDEETEDGNPCTSVSVLHCDTNMRTK